MPNIENIGRRDAELGSSSELVDGIELADEVERLGVGKEQLRREQRELGAKMLAQVGFENRHKEIVDSSFTKSRRAGKELAGKNAGRRNDAYVQRLEGLIGRYGNDLEKKIWDRSVDNLVIRPEDIEENYWRGQEQILRDNGQGRELSDYEKVVLTQDLQDKQRESLNAWANYLGDEDAPYPMWFKLYAWDGVSKMGVFDKERGEFKKRNEHTTAPFPKLNAAVLAKVYGAVKNFYGHDKVENEEARDAQLDALVKSGNFNRLYSKILLEQKAAPRTPERTEDVKGGWVEYYPGQEEELAMAAEGTPWCIADPGTGRNYLEYGVSTHDDDEEDYEYDEYDEYEGEDAEEWQNKAKFILFHLEDPETGALAENACASIRLNPDGYVAEISGLNDGQALEDVLVPIVEEKVKTLPGGEDFLDAFRDKKRLIAMDRAMQAGRKLSNEDVWFIFEEDIKTLDSYNDEDPRIGDLQRYVVDSLDDGQRAWLLENEQKAEKFSVNLILEAAEDRPKMAALEEKVKAEQKLTKEDLEFLFKGHYSLLKKMRYWEDAEEVTNKAIKELQSYAVTNLEEETIEWLLTDDEALRMDKAFVESYRQKVKLGELGEKVQAGEKLSDGELKFLLKEPNLMYDTVLAGNYSYVPDEESSMEYWWKKILPVTIGRADRETLERICQGSEDKLAKEIRATFRVHDLWEKMKNGERLSDGEVEFVFGGPETTNMLTAISDDAGYQFQSEDHYKPGYALSRLMDFSNLRKNGVSAELMLEHRAGIAGVDSGSGIGALKWYLEEGMDQQKVFDVYLRQSGRDGLRRILNRLPEILESGADVRYIAEDVVKREGKDYLVANGRVFLENGLSLETLEELAGEELATEVLDVGVTARDIIQQNIDTFLERDNIDKDKLLRALTNPFICKNVEKLLAGGLDARKVMKQYVVSWQELLEKAELFMQYGVSRDEVMKRVEDLKW